MFYDLLRRSKCKCATAILIVPLLKDKHGDATRLDILKLILATVFINFMVILIILCQLLDTVEMRWLHFI